MKITDALLGEHAVLYALFDHMETAVSAAESLPVVQAQAAMLAAALESHAHIEDALLFTALEPQIGPIGPLVVMRMEHDQIEEILAQLPQMAELNAAQQLLLQLIQMVRGHFQKEEQALFLIAHRTLTPETLEGLGEAWAARRAPV